MGHHTIGKCKERVGRKIASYFSGSFDLAHDGISYRIERIKNTEGNIYW